MSRPDSRPKLRAAWALLLLTCGAAAFGVARLPHDPEVRGAPAPSATAPRDESRSEQPALAAAPPAHGFKLPSGAPPRLSCAAAQRIVANAEARLATPPLRPSPLELASAWVGWLDPHGLWSASPDSPVPAAFEARADELLSELTRPGRSCSAFAAVAKELEAWLRTLRAAYDDAFAGAEPDSPNLLWQSLAEPVFEDDPVTRPGLALAADLGARLGAFAKQYPAEAALVTAARARYLPDEGREALTELVLAAAVRAYLPLLDPHGAFAPLDEQWALYAGDPTLDEGSALWGDMVRAPLGARVVADPAPPLELDDLVVAIEELVLPGASVEQIEQAARIETPPQGFRVRVLRAGEEDLLWLTVHDAPADSEPPLLETERVRYGKGHALVVRVPDVGDFLGEDLADALGQAEDAVGVVLDLRGNGGGSTDGAVAALGLVLPGAPLFPLIHRGSMVELMRASEPNLLYAGPLAVLVDGDTASAAEMIAGATAAYERGPVVGGRTFGKGCIQEYLDDLPEPGVLRLTTLQFVLPDGRPLQQIGITPQLPLPLPEPPEREVDLVRQPITFPGPDVRDRELMGGPAWPPAAGRIGPCSDATLCQALGRLERWKRPADRSPRLPRSRALSRD